MTAYLYVLDTLADWEIGYLTSELYSGRYLDKTKKQVSLIKTGSSLKQIKTMGGIVIVPDVQIDDVGFKAGDLLILPGANTWDDTDNRKVIEAVPGILAGGTAVAAICGATIALAKNGLLNDRAHTSNDLGWLKMTCPKYSGEKHYLDRPAVADGNLITASGHAPLEFSYETFKKMNVMKAETLEAWYMLYKTKEAKYYFDLMESLK